MLIFSRQIYFLVFRGMILVCHHNCLQQVSADWLLPTGSQENYWSSPMTIFCEFVQSEKHLPGLLSKFAKYCQHKNVNIIICYLAQLKHSERR